MDGKRLAEIEASFEAANPCLYQGCITDGLELVAEIRQLSKVNAAYHRVFINMHVAVEEYLAVIEAQGDHTTNGPTKANLG